MGSNFNKLCECSVLVYYINFGAEVDSFIGGTTCECLSSAGCPILFN